MLCLFIGRFHWLLGITALAIYLIVGIVIPILISKASGDDGIQFRTQSGDLSSFVLDNLRGLSETIQYGQGRKRLEEMNQKTDALIINEERMKKIIGRNIAITNTIILLSDLIMLFLSIMLYQKGRIEVDGVLISTIALMSSFGPVVALANLGSTLQNTFAAGNRVLDILEESPLVKEITEKNELSFSGAAAEHVTFSYDEEEVLSDISVNIPQHSIIGIVGKSGSGK